MLLNLGLLEDPSAQILVSSALVKVRRSYNRAKTP